VLDTYVSAHNALLPDQANVWLSHADEAFTKHTPTLTIDANGGFTITVRHGSTEGHWIEAIWAEDENGNICGYCLADEPDASGDYDNSMFECTVSESACSGAHIIPYEYCNLHGLWEGQPTVVADWAHYYDFVDGHNANDNYVDDTPSTHENEAFTKHTPTLTVTFGESTDTSTNAMAATTAAATATVTVRHGSTEGHFIEGLFVIDQNGELYMHYFPEPDASGDYDNGQQVASFAFHTNVVSVTPYEYCNLHGIWAGTSASISDWRLTHEYLLDHNANGNYVTDTPSTHTDDPGYTKHTPTLAVTFGDSSDSSDNVAIAATADATATVTVRHGSTESHWIEAVWVIDQNGELYMQTFAEPDASGDYDNGQQVASFDFHKNVVEVTPYESCNLHGIWVGTTASVSHWRLVHEYFLDHNANDNYVDDMPSTHLNDPGYTKHTPTVSMEGQLNEAHTASTIGGDVSAADAAAAMDATATVTVRHGSTESHWIEAVWVIDQNGELHMQTFAEPDASGDYDNGKQVASFEFHPHVTEVTPYESCNLHGVWVGTPASVTNWRKVWEFELLHDVLDPYDREDFSFAEDESFTKHAPTWACSADVNTCADAGTDGDPFSCGDVPAEDCLDGSITQLGGTIQDAQEYYQNCQSTCGLCGTCTVDVLHGSTEEHWIEGVWMIDENGELYGPALYSEPDSSGSYDNSATVANFDVHPHIGYVIAYEYCNLHGLWVSMTRSPAPSAAPTPPTYAPTASPPTYVPTTPSTALPTGYPTAGPPPTSIPTVSAPAPSANPTAAPIVSTPAPSAAPIVSATTHAPTPTPEDDQESGATAVYPSLLTLAILCASLFA